MPHNVELIVTLTGGLTAALIFGLLTNRLRLSPIVGYLLAGIAVGPFTPGYVAHRELAEQLAEVGVILLMFGVGLHFDLKDLLAVRRIAVRGAVVQIAVATALGALVTRAMGWSLSAGIVYGLGISVASTVVLLRVLSDHDALHTNIGRVAVGWLVFEDLFTVFVLVLMPVVFRAGAASSPSDIARAIGISVLKIGLLVTFTLVVGGRVLPVLLARVARTRSRELFTLTILVIALGVAVASAKLFGVSMALGAFLAGMVVGQSDFSARAASDALPMRDAFAVLFFVSMGMLFNPAELGANLGTSLAILAVVLIGKPVAALAVVLLMKERPRLAVSVAVALAQVGEFSFMVAALGVQLGVLPASSVQPLVLTAIVSITLNPLLYRRAGGFAEWIERRMGRPEGSDRTSLVGDEDASMAGVVIVGYGPVGRTLARLLREHSLAPTVIEMNYDSVAELRAAGQRAVFGDASHPEVLMAAGIARATALIFATSGSPPNETVRIAKELNPKVLVVARATYLRDVPAVRAAGASEVIAAEAEVAFAMTERLLEQLGASVEQIDRARDQVREHVRDVLAGIEAR